MSRTARRLILPLAATGLGVIFARCGRGVPTAGQPGAIPRPPVAGRRGSREVASILQAVGLAEGGEVLQEFGELGAGGAGETLGQAGPGWTASTARRAWNCSGRDLGQLGLGPLAVRVVAVILASAWMFAVPAGCWNSGLSQRIRPRRSSAPRSVFRVTRRCRMASAISAAGSLPGAAASLGGSSQTAWSRARISGRRKSSRQMRWERVRIPAKVATRSEGK